MEQVHSVICEIGLLKQFVQNPIYISINPSSPSF